MTTKKKILTPLLIIFAMIFGLSFMVYWQFRGFQKSLAEANLPEFKMPKISPELWGGKEGYQEWTDPAGLLKIKYPGYWLEMEEESLKSYFLESAAEAEVLLFAYRFNLKNPGTLAFLMIQRLKANGGIETEIEEIQKNVGEEGELKIIDQDLEKKQALLEMEYKSQSGTVIHAKEKLIATGEVFYLVTVFSPKETWPSIEEEANEIIESTTLVPEMVE